MSARLNEARLARHKELMARLKLLPIFRCLYCNLPHPTRYCPDVELTAARNSPSGKERGE